MVKPVMRLIQNCPRYLFDYQMLLYFNTGCKKNAWIILFLKCLSHLIWHRNGSVFKIFIRISVFRRKKQFVNPFTCYNNFLLLLLFMSYFCLKYLLSMLSLDSRPVWNLMFFLYIIQCDIVICTSTPDCCNNYSCQ